MVGLVMFSGVDMGHVITKMVTWILVYVTFSGIMCCGMVCLTNYVMKYGLFWEMGVLIWVDHYTRVYNLLFP